MTWRRRWASRWRRLALPLIGCAAVGPDYVRPAAIVPAQYKEIKGWKPATPRDDFAKGEWWTAVSRPRAEQAGGAGRRLQPDAESRRGELPRGSGADRRGARRTVSRPLNFDPSLTRSSSQGQITDLLDAQVSAAWTLDVWGKVRRAIEQQGAGAQVSAADLANATLSAQSALALAYVQLRQSDSLDDLLANTVKQYQRSLDITQNQYDGGNGRQVRRHHRAGAGAWRRRRSRSTSASRARRTSTRSPC